MCLIMTEDGWQQLGNGKVCSNHNKLEGVFRPTTIEDAQTSNSLRAHAYESDVRMYLNGNLRKEELFRAFDTPVYGAFGEKL